MNHSPLLELAKPPLLHGQSVEDKRQELKTYFRQTWALYESLFSLINNDEAYYLRPEPLRHPLIFYYGHTAVFYINKLMLGKYIDKRVNQRLESICAVGVDEMSWDDLKPGNYQWPDVQEVRDYRNQVAELVEQLIDTMPLQLPISQDSLAWVILMGCEHERIHIETSSVIMRMLDLPYLTPDEAWRACDAFGDAPSNRLLPVAAQSMTLGKPQSNDTYGWDNEYGTENHDVEAFEASQYLVSNGEFLEFIAAGGYHSPHLWDEEGQQWLAFTKAEMPRFWSQKNGEYWQRNLLDERPLPLNWPVEVNYLEAKAFCNWKDQQDELSVRLPTEAEWQVLRDQIDTDLPQWSQAPGNINMEHFASSCPVDQFQPAGFADVIGNVWQWTESPIDAYEGFAVHPLYDDFSTPTFDGKHNLIKGGSWISTGNEACRDSRYAFRRHFFQHAGFRYVRSANPEVPVKPVKQFEAQPEISQLLHHQYGPKSQAPEHDLQQIAAICKRLTPKAQSVLDIGCGTGGLTFELARFAEHVTGIDFTARNIQHALQFKEQGNIRYALPDEGELQHFYEVTLADLDLEAVADKVAFMQGDGHNLKPQFSGYDLIVCHRVLESVYDPKHFLTRMAERLEAGGLLVLSSAYQWSEQATEKSKWLGGFKQDGENLTGFAGLQQHLAGQFELLEQREIETRLQLNSRGASLLQNHLTVWRKTS